MGYSCCGVLPTGDNLAARCTSKPAGSVPAPFLDLLLLACRSSRGSLDVALRDPQCAPWPWPSARRRWAARRPAPGRPAVLPPSPRRPVAPPTPRRPAPGAIRRGLRQARRGSHQARPFAPEKPARPAAGARSPARRRLVLRLQGGLPGPRPQLHAARLRRRHGRLPAGALRTASRPRSKMPSAPCVGLAPRPSAATSIPTASARWASRPGDIWPCCWA